MATGAGAIVSPIFEHRWAESLGIKILCKKAEPIPLKTHGFNSMESVALGVPVDGYDQLSRLAKP
jgi:hypothetical protein